MTGAKHSISCDICPRERGGQALLSAPPRRYSLSMTQPLKLFVIDDHDDVRAALVVRLCAAPGVFVIGEARATEAAIEEVKALQPDVVLIETQCAHGRGLEWVSRIAQANSQTRVMALTSFPSEW